jgi:predicted nucleic acid-binding protein
MIVVDASAAVEILLQLETADILMQRLLADGETLHAPHLLDVEVAQVIRRYARNGDITPLRGSEAIRDLADLPITRYAHDELLERIWQLRNNLTAYDAAYIALAEALDAPLVTRDSGLKRVPGVRTTIEVL